MTAIPSDVPNLIKAGLALRRSAAITEGGQPTLWEASRETPQTGMLAQFGPGQMTALTTAATALSAAITALSTPVNTLTSSTLATMSQYSTTRGINLLSSADRANIATAAPLATSVLNAAVAVLKPALELAAVLGVKPDPNLAPFDNSRWTLRDFLRSIGLSR